MINATADWPRAIAASGRLLSWVSAIIPPGEHGQAPRLARAKTDLENIPGSKRAVNEALRFGGLGARTQQQLKIRVGAWDREQRTNGRRGRMTVDGGGDP